MMTTFSKFFSSSSPSHLAACIIHNNGIRGHPIRIKTDISSATFCQYLCQTVPECKYFTYNVQSSYCFMHDNIDIIAYYPQDVTGTMLKKVH